MTESEFDSITDEMGTAIRELRQEIMSQNILIEGFKKHIGNMERENKRLTSIIERRAA